MCGIYAYINVNNKKDITNSFDKGKSRGPENTASVVIDNNFLGFHRLAINGLDDISNQPFFIDGIYLICNGEIYNHKSFKYPRITNSDCEVIIYLYKEFGIEYLLQLLDGVFSFVLYDTNIKRIYIARDPYGVRPLYYYQCDNNIIFASEIKQINLPGLRHFKPSHFMEINVSGHHYKMLGYTRYSNFPFSKMIFNNIFDIYGLIYQKISIAVKKRTILTDRPIACLLSGGLDSSTIAALVNSFLPKGVLETYSIGLEGSTDLVYAQIVADHIGSKHTSIVLSEDTFFESIPEVIKAIETYDTTTIRASVGNYLIGKYIKEHSNAKVIFNGDGADELMGGYRYFNSVPNDTEFDRECKRLLSDIYYFDVLRSDRCISTHGLEPRTPFLDRSFVEMYLSIPSNLRCHRSVEQPEKYLLRSAIKFMNPGLLPDSVLFRTKEAFSDGVSGIDRSWYTIIQEKLKNEPLTLKVDINIPQTQEQTYYRTIFEMNYPGCEDIVPYFWMPKYVIATDPSARCLSN
jgi:asparagine synthase (glutamine-hydrolysing)